MSFPPSPPSSIRWPSSEDICTLSSTSTSIERDAFFSPLFPQHNETDLILRTLEGVSFGVKRANMVAHCGIFDDMFSLPSSSRSQQPVVVDVQDDSQLLEKFLRYTDRSTFRIGGDPPTFTTLESLESFLSLCDKYGATSILDQVLCLHLPRFLQPQTCSRTNKTTVPVLEVFFLAATYNDISLARAALALFGTWGNTAPGVVCWKESKGGYVQGWRSWDLIDLGWEKYARLPKRVVFEFSRVSGMVRTQSAERGLTWKMAAEDFMVD